MTKIVIGDLVYEELNRDDNGALSVNGKPVKISKMSGVVRCAFEGDVPLEETTPRRVFKRVLSAMVKEIGPEELRRYNGLLVTDVRRNEESVGELGNDDFVRLKPDYLATFFLCRYE